MRRPEKGETLTDHPTPMPLPPDHEDWNAQAAKAAKTYLSTSHFSCAGLIQQLSSDFGDQYTKAQATYGAKKAGVCWPTSAEEGPRSPGNGDPPFAV